MRRRGGAAVRGPCLPDRLPRVGGRVVWWWCAGGGFWHGVAAPGHFVDQAVGGGLRCEGGWTGEWGTSS